MMIWMWMIGCSGCGRNSTERILTDPGRIKEKQNLITSMTREEIVAHSDQLVALGRELNEESDEGLHVVLLIALGYTENPEALTILREHIFCNHPRSARKVVATLWEYGGRGACGVLIDAFLEAELHAPIHEKRIAMGNEGWIKYSGTPAYRAEQAYALDFGEVQCALHWALQSPTEENRACRELIHERAEEGHSRLENLLNGEVAEPGNALFTWPSLEQECPFNFPPLTPPLDLYPR